MAEIRDVDEIADELLPVDGPHTPDGVVAAASLIGELVRRLNHATQPHRAPRSLLYPATVYRTASYLHRAAALLPQALEQLAARMDRLAEQPGLYDDRHAQAPAPAADTAGLTAFLLREATTRAGMLADELADVTRHAVHLGMNTVGGEE